MLHTSADAPCMLVGFSEQWVPRVGESNPNGRPFSLHGWQCSWTVGNWIFRMLNGRVTWCCCQSCNQEKKCLSDQSAKVQTHEVSHGTTVFHPTQFCAFFHQCCLVFKLLHSLCHCHSLHAQTAKWHEHCAWSWKPTLPCIFVGSITRDNRWCITESCADSQSNWLWSCCF